MEIRGNSLGCIWEGKEWNIICSVRAEGAPVDEEGMVKAMEGSLGRGGRGFILRDMLIVWNLGG